MLLELVIALWRKGVIQVMMSKELRRDTVLSQTYAAS